MRPQLATCLLMVLLAGCASPPEAPRDLAAADADAPFVPPSAAGATMPRLRFDAPEFNQTTTYDDAFA